MAKMKTIIQTWKDQPMTFSMEIVEEICMRIAGGDDVDSICKEPGYPHKTTYYRWLREYPDAKLMHDDAMKDKMLGYAEEAVKIADGDKPRYIEVPDRENGGTIMQAVPSTPEEVARDRLRIQARQWNAKHLHNAVFGDSQTVNHNHSGEVTHSIHNLIAGDDKIVDVTAKAIDVTEENQDDEEESQG